MSGLQGGARSPRVGSAARTQAPTPCGCRGTVIPGRHALLVGQDAKGPLPGAWGGRFRFSGQCDSMEGEGFGAGQTQGSGQLCW